jgi:hypothetical protein
MLEMSGLDLNASPAEDDLLYDTEPQFCNQAASPEMVGESPDPIGQFQEEVVDDSDVRNGRGLGTSGPAHNAGENSLPTTTIPTTSTTYPDLDEGATDGVGNQGEVLSSPQEPYLGMRFDTIEAARAHYNAYAAKKGFSV